MDLERSNLILEAGRKDELEKMIWSRWLVDLQGMDKENFISFDEYKKMMIKPVKTSIEREKPGQNKNILDMDKLRKNADRIREKLDPKKDLHIKKGKKKRTVKK